MSASSPLLDHLLRQGEFERVQVLPRTSRYSSAAAWTRAAAAGEGGRAVRTRLQRRGFVRGLSRPLRAWHGVGVVKPFKPYWHGWSAVIQFRTDGSARAEVVAMARAAAADRGVFEADFAVPGIPGARGFLTERESGGEATIVFAEGRFVHVTQFGHGPGAHAMTARPALAERLREAASRLYRRVASHRVPA